MEAMKINKICIALLNHRVHHLKKDIEYLNSDDSLDVYGSIEAVLADTKDSPPEKLQFFYDKLFEFYGKKNSTVDAKFKAMD